ncbi:nickel pincer cofactor biosynthesis protein LarC [candidate division NPL-UPA2 bacterium]|nr:nickel pincer cofactor biosynthesis protein LarC [candidate division NPL-UPA2 bacterium]
MRIAYFDCFSGISGDMILGALIDAGLSVGDLRRELKKLELRDYQIEVRTVSRQNLRGKKFQVKVSSDKAKEYSLGQILRLIEKSNLNVNVKEKSKKIFRKLGMAEAKVHGQKEEAVHFHEVGAIDSLVDIVGSLVGIEILGVDKIYSSPLSLGRGWVNCQHGRLPVPAPTTVELLQGISILPSGEEEELVTPTGAAIITALAESFSHPPPMRIEVVGYGAGARSLTTRPNLLRVLVGQSSGEYERDEVTVIETNIDDMNPQVYSYLQERLFEAGALDVFLTSVQMKKGRPGTLITVLAEASRVEALTTIILEETSSLGVRTYRTQRQKLSRDAEEMKTKFGKVKVKIAKMGEKIKHISPEYEDCRRIAQRKRIPFREVYEEAKRQL